MRAPVRSKQPGEGIRQTFDFTKKLAAGDTVAAVVGGALEATGITVGAPSISGNMVTARISGGSGIHRVSCRVTTTQGDTLELDIDVHIVDGEN